MNRYFVFTLFLIVSACAAHETQSLKIQQITEVEDIPEVAVRECIGNVGSYLMLGERFTKHKLDAGYLPPEVWNACKEGNKINFQCKWRDKGVDKAVSLIARKNLSTWRVVKKKEYEETIDYLDCDNPDTFL